MSSRIAELLAQIASAVRGAEVRDAIHDAIEECYDDVWIAKTAADASVTAANAAASNANTAAGNAEAKATLASDAVSRVDEALDELEETSSTISGYATRVENALTATATAIGSCETAVTAANTATTNANTAAGNAEAKAQRANDAADAAYEAAAAAGGGGSITIDPALSPTSQNAVQNRAIKAAIDALQSQIDALNYEPIAVTAFSVNPSSVEMGATVTAATLSWTLNKEATTALLDGESVSLSGTSGTIALSGLSLTANKTWTLAVTDGQEATASKTATLRFQNRVYYGTAAQPESVNESFVKALANAPLSDNRSRSFTATAASDEYIWYAVPTRLGSCSFKVGGFDGGFERAAANLSVTNASGGSENYYVYRSTNAGLGNTTVTVS